MANVSHCLPHLTLGVGWVEGLAAGPGGPGSLRFPWYRFEAGTLNLARWGLGSQEGSKPLQQAP